MILTFPQMGNATIPIKALLDDLHIAYVPPQENTTGALEQGTRLVPEGACLPLKICVGTLMEACRQGADTILMASALGPCRFGYYCQMQQEILEDAGYKTQAIHFVPPRGHPGPLIRELSRLKGSISWPRFLWYAAHAARIAYQVDHLEQMYFHLQPRETHMGQTDACYKEFRHKARQTIGTKAMLELLADTRKRFAQIDWDDGIQPLRIGIVGEIYDVIDPFSSMYLQEKLGRMGVEVSRPVTISSWVDHLPGLLHLGIRNDSFQEAAKPYLKMAIGGHAQETLGHAALMAHEGLDGVIQLFPLGCMPEIVAQCIMPDLSAKENIPVLTLILDEMTAEAGMMTRVEAFLDLLYARREARQKPLEKRIYSIRKAGE